MTEELPDWLTVIQPAPELAEDYLKRLRACADADAAAEIAEQIANDERSAAERMSSAELEHLLDDWGATVHCVTFEDEDGDVIAAVVGKPRPPRIQCRCGTWNPDLGCACGNLSCPSRFDNLKTVEEVWKFQHFVRQQFGPRAALEPGADADVIQSATEHMLAALAAREAELDPVREPPRPGR